MFLLWRGIGSSEWILQTSGIMQSSKSSEPLWLWWLWWHHRSRGMWKFSIFTTKCCLFIRHHGSDDFDYIVPEVYRGFRYSPQSDGYYKVSRLWRLKSQHSARCIKKFSIFTTKWCIFIKHQSSDDCDAYIVSEICRCFRYLPQWCICIKHHGSDDRPLHSARGMKSFSILTTKRWIFI